jgi:hypothetical protein
MEAILRELLLNVNDIIAGLPLEFEKIPEEHRRSVMVMCLHCILNGPVGVQKSTTFPMIGGPHKISDFVKTTNSSWKGFCFLVAQKVKELKPDIPCGTKRKAGEYWPLKEA